MEIDLVRNGISEQGTFGVFLFNDVPICLSLEKPWRNNQPRESCIPSGRYEVEPLDHSTYQLVFHLPHVPDRTEILIHPFNTENESYGCIAPGCEFGYIGDKPAVLHSRKGLELLRKAVRDESFRLNIWEYC